ncbi:MAG: sugar phosphate isomerase/epimerase [Candidatus Poribacteria bacterium]|nr:sugar phosphate isomerase/epimerase [Candidatus Poribacteria bacterium]
MKFIMFTKHLEGLDVAGIIRALQSVGVEGADLCVRPGYPVNPDNAEAQLPATAKQFAAEGLSIPLVTAPTSFLDPNQPDLQRVYAGCAEAGVANIKIGYWHWSKENGGYWAQIDRIRSDLDAFQALSEKHGVRTCLHNHSGISMALNSSAVMNLVKGFDPRYVGVFADTGHLSIVGEPIDMALDIVKDYLAVMAFKDLMRAPGSRGTRVIRMGHGFVDWETALRTLKELNFDGPVSFHSEYSGEPTETVIDLARIDVRYINGLLEKIAE